MDEPERTHLKIGIVGPCAAGKSTLAEALKRRGYNARNIAQEHSYVPTMWQRITNPDLLIYLHVSYEVSMQRRWMNWTPDDYAEQLRRLSHARAHAVVEIDTDPLTVDEVVEKALGFLTADR